MAGLFYNLGLKTGTTLRKAKWVYQSATGTEADSVRAEFGVGRDLAAALEQELPLDSEGELSRRVSVAGADLARRLVDGTRRFQFRVVLSAEANAFALPGGFVYVTRPLLELCEQNSDEIAFILGHEMGHVVRRHAIERLISNTAISAATRTTRAGRLIGGQLAGLGAKFLTSAYSQAQEFEADLFGARLLRSSGLDPRGAVRALQRLQELGGRRDESVLAAYLSSHPPAGDRVERIQRLLTHLQRTQPRKSSR